MSSSEVTLKATPFLAIVTYMNEQLPAAARERIIGSLAPTYPEDARHMTAGKVLATDTFSLRFATDLIERLAAELGRGAEAVAYEIGRRGAEASTGGVLRFVFALIAMSSYLGKIQPVWSKFYSHGRITYSTAGRSAIVQLDDFPFVSATNCARVTGSLEWFGQRAEKTAVLRHVECRSHGAERCRWEVTW